uniref:Uncharacterized protein n=1 Tax=Hyaloperonospora arabidopsidis (strain Emoy2) TaxID=559515 RepID=M4C5W5_HYAAE
MMLAVAPIKSRFNAQNRLPQKVDNGLGSLGYEAFCNTSAKSSMVDTSSTKNPQRCHARDIA